MLSRSDDRRPPVLQAIGFAVACYGLGRIMPMMVLPEWRILPAVLLVGLGLWMGGWLERWLGGKPKRIEPWMSSGDPLAFEADRRRRPRPKLGLFLCVLGAALLSGGVSALPLALLFPVVVGRSPAEEEAIEDEDDEEIEAGDEEDDEDEEDRPNGAPMVPERSR